MSGSCELPPNDEIMHPCCLIISFARTTRYTFRPGSEAEARGDDAIHCILHIQSIKMQYCCFIISFIRNISLHLSSSFTGNEAKAHGVHAASCGQLTLCIL